MHPLLQISIVVTAFFANALVIVLFMLRPVAASQAHL